MATLLPYTNGFEKRTVWELGRDLPERPDYAPPQLIPSRDTPISTPLWPGPSYVEDKRENTPQHEERSYVSQEPIGETGGTSVNYACDFDAIGNRKDRQEGKNERLYEASNLNHYEEIVGEYASFAPGHDEDGNQTRLQKSH